MDEEQSKIDCVIICQKVSQGYCQNLGTSSRPQYKQDTTLNTVNGVGNEERGRVVKRENTRHNSFLSFPHFYWLLLVILDL